MYKRLDILILRIFMVAVLAFAITGCTKHQSDSMTECCLFKVSVEPLILTKSGQTGQPPVLADRCLMELFYEGQSAGQFTTQLISGQAQFNVRVVSGRVYDVVFWADKEGCYETESLRNVCFKESGYDVADNSMDAYSAVCNDIEIGFSQNVYDVTLTRPFAQISVSGAGEVSTRFTAPESYDILMDELGQGREFTYQNTSFFVLAPKDKSYMDISIGESLYTGIPFQRNYRTNISINNL